MEAAKIHLDSLETAFALARALRDQEALAEALAIAQAGLSLPGPPHRQYELAAWVSELAEGLGDSQKALAARVAAFKARPSLGDYQQALKLAGADESTMRAELLQLLRRHQGWDSDSAKVDIFLQEGLLDDAIAAVEALGYHQADLVKQVMAAALNERPDWVMANAAYLASGQPEAWQAYRNRLLERHARKYKLVGMLKQRELA